MSPRVVRILGILGLIDILVFALTIHAHMSFHRKPGGPTVMPLGQLMGWFIGFFLLFAIVVILFAARTSEKYKRAEQGL